MRKIFLATAALLALVSCTEKFDDLTARVMDVARQQCILMDERLADNVMPKTFKDGINEDSPLKWWCSGFFPGTLWEVYQATGDEEILAIAAKQTLKLSGICHEDTHHDIGFQVNSSFGNAYRATGDPCWLPVIDSAATKLAGRFIPAAGIIQSWKSSKKWDCPVIIDNMMNLELLEYASKLFDKPQLDAIACSHADVTMKNHFRDDYTTWHVLAYDRSNGDVIKKQTHQGYSDDSAWSRGQAWALYGYTMCYRYTSDPRYLEHARKVAAFILNHPRLPEDLVPYWDFDAPGIPDEPRDASAAAIIASALYELEGYSPDNGYRQKADKIVESLATDAYLARRGTNGNFILMHSVGSIPHGNEIDVPLSYADYYYLEALTRRARK